LHNYKAALSYLERGVKLDSKLKGVARLRQRIGKSKSYLTGVGSSGAGNRRR
jgi:hypothetical protein